MAQSEARRTVMGGANTNLEKCGATIATWMPHVTVEAGKHIRSSPARTRRSVVHGTALHTGFRSVHWFTSQCDSLKTHVLLATRRSEGGHLSRRHRRRQKLLVARNGAPSLRCGGLQKPRSDVSISSHTITRGVRRQWIFSVLGPLLHHDFDVDGCRTGCVIEFITKAEDTAT